MQRVKTVSLASSSLPLPWRCQNYGLSRGEEHNFKIEAFLRSQTSLPVKLRGQKLSIVSAERTCFGFQLAELRPVILELKMILDLKLDLITAT